MTPNQASNFDLHLVPSYCTLIVERPTNTKRAMTGAIMPSTARASNTLSYQQLIILAWLQAMLASMFHPTFIQLYQPKKTATMKRGSKASFTFTGQTYQKRQLMLLTCVKRFRSSGDQNIPRFQLIG